jgi:hypothetical protein
MLHLTYKKPKTNTQGLLNTDLPFTKFKHSPTMAIKTVLFEDDNEDIVDPPDYNNSSPSKQPNQQSTNHNDIDNLLKMYAKENLRRIG